MKFTQTTTSRWDSDKMAVSAAVLKKNSDGSNSDDILAIHEPQFTILQAEAKTGKIIYRLYEQHMGRKIFVKRFNTLDAAIKYANK